MILDLKLPKVDGLEVLQRVKSDPHADAPGSGATYHAGARHSRELPTRCQQLHCQAG